MKSMAQNLKTILLRKGVSQKELAEITGLSTSAISDYINSKTLMSPGNLQIISDALHVEKSDIDPTFRGTIDHVSSDVTKLPVVGKISCGTGTVAYEMIEDYEDTPKSWLNGGEYFYLRAQGDSMINARIYNGDLLLIRKQPEVENGEIAAVLIGEEAVLKRVYRNGDSLVLQSENPTYPPIFCPPAEAKILGKLKKIIINCQ
ncbi:repressor [Brevibacillus brevis]|nr:repressor [Brevibacillus brevis]